MFFSLHNSLQALLINRNRLYCQLAILENRYIKLAGIVFTIARHLIKFALSAPVAQLDRVPDYESGGRGFESSPVRQKNTKYF